MTMASVAETQAQAMRPSRAEVSEQESLQLMRNLLQIAMSNISYVRGFSLENFHREIFLPAQEMKVKMKVNKLLPMDMESKGFIDWAEKGVFDALQKKYLSTLLTTSLDISSAKHQKHLHTGRSIWQHLTFLTICRGQDGPPIEECTC